MLVEELVITIVTVQRNRDAAVRSLHHLEYLHSDVLVKIRWLFGVAVVVFALSIVGNHQ